MELPPYFREDFNNEPEHVFTRHVLIEKSPPSYEFMDKEKQKAVKNQNYELAAMWRNCQRKYYDKKWTNL